MTYSPSRMVVPPRYGGRVAVKIEPRDIWVGVYWNLRRSTPSTHVGVDWLLEVYVCVVPLLPIKVTLWRLRREGDIPSSSEGQP